MPLQSYIDCILLLSRSPFTVVVSLSHLAFCASSSCLLLSLLPSQSPMEPISRQLMLVAKVADLPLTSMCAQLPMRIISAPSSPMVSALLDMVVSSWKLACSPMAMTVIPELTVSSVSVPHCWSPASPAPPWFPAPPWWSSDPPVPPWWSSAPSAPPWWFS